MKTLVKHKKSELKELSEEELEYYSRQVVMTEMGYNVQLKLKNSKACLVGVGGLGSPAAMQLAAIGVGYLRIVDRDIVEITNLHRQHLYGVDDLGYPKVEAATKRLKGLNPFIDIEPLPLSVNEYNAEKIVNDMDVVVDGLDSMNARYAINRACVKLGIPYVFGATIATSGNLSTIIPGETACLECFYGNLDDKKLPKCGIVGVHPSVVNVIASLEVSEAIKILSGKQPRLINKLLYFDLIEMEFNETKLSRVDSCPVCGQYPSSSSFPLKHELVEEICGRNGKKTLIINPKEPIDFNFEGLKSFLRKEGVNLNVDGKLGVTFYIHDVKMSVLKSGISILEGINEKKQALKLFNKIIGKHRKSIK